MKSLIVIFFMLTSLYFPVRAMTLQSPEFLQRYDSELLDVNGISTLYKNNNSLWLNKQRLTNQAYDALDFIATAPRHGLNAEHYHLSTLRQLQQSDDNEASQYFDVLLTDGVLAFIHDLVVGRLEARLAEPEWFIPQAEFDAVDFLQQALLSPYLKTQLNTLIPNSREYVQLMAALAIEDNQFPDLATESIEQYDSLTEQAVRRFQSNHGLKDDGIMGPETRSELNVSAQDRVKQIKATLERQRWMPTNLGARYVQVNLANYTLSAVENNTKKLAMRIIVGNKYRQTPSFVSQITRLVANPYWTVPL